MKTDPETRRMQDEWRRAGWREAVMLIARMIRDGGGMPRDCQPMKGLKPDSYDRCSHGKYRYEDCYQCLADWAEAQIREGKP
jgi:hypothetical protein